MKNLPQEIIDIIWEYANVKCRNGIYMSQIAATDPRYSVLKTIKPIQQFKNINNNYFKYYRVILKNICYIEYYPKEYNIELNKWKYKKMDNVNGYHSYVFYPITEHDLHVTYNIY